MFCIYCGARVADDAKRCPSCGSALLMEGEPKTAPEAAQTSEPEALNTEPVTQDTIIAEGPILPKAQENEEDGRDIYSSAPHRFRPEPEMEDISSGRQMEIPQAEYTPPVNTNTAQQEIPHTGYRDNYVYEEYQEAPPKKKRAWIWIVVVILILAAIGGTAAGIYMWYSAPSQQFSRALAANDYEAITQLLPQLEDSEREALAADMKTYAAEVVERYNKGEVEYGTAYDLVDRLQRLFPDAPQLKSAAEDMKALKTSKEDYASALSAEQSGDVSGALRLFGSVIEKDTNYADAQTHIEAIKSDYKENILKQAQALAAAGDYIGAQELLTSSSTILGDDADIAEKMAELQDQETEEYVTGLLELAQEMADEKDYIGAVKLLQDAEKQDTRFVQQIEKYREAYKAEKLEEAEGYAQASDYEEAVAVLESALEFLGEDEKLNAKIAQYKEMYPVLLTNLAPSGGTNCNSVWGATAANGTTYSNGLSFALYPELAESVYTEYSPEGKYKRFSGTWVIDGSTTEGFIGKVRVYVDGALQYELSSLTLNSGAAEMNLLITGAQTIRIEAEGAFTDPFQVGYIYLADATFKN